MEAGPPHAAWQLATSGGSAVMVSQRAAGQGDSLPPDLLSYGPDACARHRACGVHATHRERERERERDGCQARDIAAPDSCALNKGTLSSPGHQGDLAFGQTSFLVTTRMQQ